MSIEEFYNEKWTGDPETKDKFWKCAPRFSYDDMISFAESYSNKKCDVALSCLYDKSIKFDFIVVHTMPSGAVKLLISPEDMHSINMLLYDNGFTEKYKKVDGEDTSDIGRVDNGDTGKE